MGEVYRGRDTKLDRDVAIKVLPATFASDPERIARFQREAKTLASLNHPHIGAIYGFEEAQGIAALVLELVEGPTLAEQIARGPIPLDEALAIAKQIAKALEAAHEQGIVHRDLKPANIKLTQDGKVKVLDFGLAKAMEQAPGSGLQASGVSQSPTITSPAMTIGGMILGTAAYMSPEQARGKPVDKRADIWAFGCVLYEMLTGTRAFEAEDVSLTLSRVLQSEPNFDALSSSVPARVRQALQLSLRKDATQRVSDIRDMSLVLDGAFETVVVPRGEVATSTSRFWMAAALTCLVVAVAVLVIDFRQAPPYKQTLRYQIPASENELIASFALSPDGQQLAYTTGTGPFNTLGINRLWIRPLDSLDAHPLRGSEGAIYPFWSPDSRTIGFFADGKLKKINLAGGPPQTVCDAPFGETGVQMGSWNQEGIILLTGGRRLHQVSEAGGEARPVTALDASRQEVVHVWPQFLPDGRHFLYTAASAVLENSAVYVASLDSQETKRLLTSNARAAYTQDVTGQGYVLFLREQTLMSQRFDAARLELQGEPFPVAESVAALPVGFRGTAQGLLAHFTSSAGGVLSYRRGGTAAVELVWFDRAGRRSSTVGEPAEYSNVALSPDEKRLAISRVDSKLGTRDIWLFDLDRGVPTKFTFDPEDEMNPVWSPDGQRIAFSSSRKGGPRDIYVKNANGAGDAHLLFESGDSKSMTDWSADGRHVLVNNSVFPLDGERTPVRLPPGVTNPRVSPDGRWLAYHSNESGRLEIYVQSFPGLLAGRSAGKWLISTAGGSYPEWRRDSREIFYVGLDGTLMAASVTASGPAFENTPPTPLFSVRLDPAGRRAHYQPAANGQRFLVAQLLEQERTNPLTVVVNWSAGLTR